MTGRPSRDQRRHKRRPWQPLPGTPTPPVPIRSALDTLASTLGLSSVDSVNALFLGWVEIVGRELADHCTPRRLTDGVLTVETSDVRWATELRWMKNLIAERCCEALGAGTVTEVRITHRIR